MLLVHIVYAMTPPEVLGSISAHPCCAGVSGQGLGGYWHTVDAALLGVGRLLGPDCQIQVELVESGGLGPAGAGRVLCLRHANRASTASVRFRSELESS